MAAQPHVVIIGGGQDLWDDDGHRAQAQGLHQLHRRFSSVRRNLAGPGACVVLLAALRIRQFANHSPQDNIYPGCSSDVAIHMYSLSSALSPDWTHTHAFQPEIHAYWLAIAQKYDLYANVLFNREVVSARWDPLAQAYTVESVELELEGTGVRTECAPITATVLVSALGMLEIPRFPESIPGWATFAGPSFHSARWDYSVGLQGKRVAVIGSGASATQYVPLLASDPSIDVTQYVRSPFWILPPVRAEYSATHRWLLRNIPGWLRMYRCLHFLWTELLYLVIFSNRFTNGLLEAKVRSYVRKTAPAEYADQILPPKPDSDNYRLGCRRLVYDTSYLSSLALPNMHMERDHIEAITPRGIVTKNKGLKEVDVLIFGTGYVTDSYSIPITGTSGKTVKEYFNEQGGPTAYLGTAIPGFPNFFMLFVHVYLLIKLSNAGPNTATGHTSVLFATECQVAYILRLLDPLFSGALLSLEPTPAATDKYNRAIQRRLQGFVWSGKGCGSWYRAGGTKAGEEGKEGGKIHGLFPGSMSLYWWWMRRPVWRDFKVVAVGGWKPESPFGGALGWCGAGAMVIGAGLGLGALFASWRWGLGVLGY
ncbi:hypothetical protein MKEN_01157000 [Mycena kentingensis (nom. inval.)]|nr:hypothetical protein MKEN_01157000 [Mycena kentingensis (nom. inval.)]